MSVDVAAFMSVADTGSYLSSVRDPLFDDTADATFFELSKILHIYYISC